MERFTEKQKIRTKGRSFRREVRYLLLMPTYEMGGAETQFRYFIEYAEKNNWELDVIIEQRFQKASVLLQQDIKQMKNVQFYQLHEYGVDRNKMRWHIIKQILKNLLRVRYKTCLIYNPVYLALVPAMRILGIDVVYSERVSAADVAKNIWLQRYLRRCNRIFANSEYGRDTLQGIIGKKVGLIRNGRPVVEQLAVKEDREVLRVLVPCRIKAHKNQMLLLHYLKDYPDFAGKIIFAGMVEDKEYQRKLVNFVSRNHLQGRVEFLGYVENMRDEYEKADLVVLPSCLEGTPNVVLEAYAYGRPVIVSDIEAERYVVQNPNLRFGLDETDGINRCIAYIQSLSDIEYRELLKKNRRFVAKNYSIPKMAEKIYAVLK